MTTRAQLSETIHRLLPGEANKRIRQAILEAAAYSGTRTDQLRQSIDQANRIQTGVLINGTVEITTDTNADLTEWAWVSNFAVQQQDGPESITILAPDDDYIRADYFIGMPDGTIDYRPSTIDPLGNSMPPTIDPDEVVLRVIQRNPDGSTEDVPMEQGRFPDTEFYTQADFDTTGLYAPVWRTRVQPHQSFILQLDYGSPSDSLDWATSPSARSSRLNLAIYCQAGVAVTGIIFETLGGGSAAGDWALVRDGDELTLYHKSVSVWMRVSFRATFLAMAATTSQFLQAQTYAALPTGDQLFESEPLAGGGGSGDKGWSPILAVVTDGARRVHQVTDWTGGEGDKPATGQYIGSTGYVTDIADAVNIRGAAGGDGDNGLNGWSPILSTVSDGERRVHRIVDWTGGTGSKPTTGQYIGGTGYVTDIADGVDIRGPEGAGGSGGGGVAAANAGSRLYLFNNY